MFALSGSLDSPSVVLININIAFATYGENICLPTTEVILRAAADKLARSKNHQDWKPRNAVLLLPFLTEAAIIDWRSDTGELLRIFARSVTNRAEKGEDNGGDDDNNNDNEIEGGVEAEEEKKTKTGKKKQATAETLATITYSYNDVLDFLQSVAIKSPQVTAATLSLCADKRAHLVLSVVFKKTSPRRPSCSHNITQVSRAS